MIAKEVKRGIRLRKKTRRALFAKRYEEIFRCPLCDAGMSVVDLKQLVCQNNHSFDFAKQGYVNLLTRPAKSKYDKALFEARQQLMKEGSFFAPVLQAIKEKIEEFVTFQNDELLLLDSGCGEGTHLHTLCHEYLKTNGNVVGVGIDIAKEGIFVAAKNYDDVIWCVADLANTPFQDGQFNVIVNILSPSNYQEFHRLLKKDGILIKVVPTGDYLREVREALFDSPDKQTYSNESIVKHFKENFQLIAHEEVHYTVGLSGEHLRALVEMTPLSWSVKKEKIDEFLRKEAMEITVSLEIIVGRS